MQNIAMRTQVSRSLQSHNHPTRNQSIRVSEPARPRILPTCDLARDRATTQELIAKVPAQFART
eukprot:9595743-Lingulodinium_polyedra.AAC.1